MKGRYNYVWDAVRTEFLKQNAGKMKDAELAKEMTRRFGRYFSVAAIRLRRRAIGIKKENGRGRCEIKKT